MKSGIATRQRTTAFPRVRVGIGRPPEGVAVVEYVLSPFDAAQADDVARAVTRAADAVERIVADGITPAMQAFNGL